jgi:hypothetical protein
LRSVRRPLRLRARHAHLVSSTVVASAGVSFLDNSAATRMRVPRSGIGATCESRRMKIH